MTEYFDSIAKRIASILLTLAVSFALFACADIGERDNPVDPGYKGNASNEAGASVAKGSMTDPRDGQTYKTVTIGTQTWMAENLNYKTSSSYCYEDYAGNCSKYGRLYEWSAAMNACPTGWHLPNDEEWNTLWDAVGGTGTAGTKLKSSSGWNSGGNGTGSFGFAVLPAGYRYNFGYFNDEGNDAYFWSSTEVDSSSAFRWYFSYGRDYVNNYWNNKNYGFSVRCLRDSDEGSGASSSSSQAQPSSSSSDIILSSSSSVILSESEGSSSSSIKYGLLTDSRDGQVYKTVTIGTQTWMAENLNYNTSDSYCYDDNASYCSKYGRLYEWSAAMKACPTGWHLPSNTEWNTLWNAVGGTSTAGRSLKSTSGWYGGGNGTDSFGFAVLPAGDRNDSGDFSREGDLAFFWSSTEYYSHIAYNWHFGYDDDNVSRSWYDKSNGFSVRCLRD